MKTLIISILFLLISITGFTQNGISYKALIKDTNGNVVTSTTVDIQFTIYEGQALTNNVYQESHTINTDANGFVITSIGIGNTIAGNFTTIDWSNDEHFLNVQVDIGSGMTDMGTTQFMAVPYALSSGDHPWSKNENGVHTLNEDVGINNENPEHTLDVRSISQAEPSGFNLSNSDKSRYLRFFSGSDMFPDPSITLASDRSLLFASFDDNTSVFNEYMRISPLGDIGIGINDPQAKLDIKGGDWNLEAGNPGDLRIGNVTNNFRIGVATGGGGAGVTRLYTNSNALILGTNNVRALLVDTNGNVGVGLDTPTQKLEINGKIKIGDESTTSTPGTLRYNSNENRFEGYTNEGWKILGQKKKKIVVGSSSFSSRVSSNYFNSATRAFYSSGAGTSHIIYAPVVIPVGARMTSINYLYYDNDPTNDLLLTLSKSCGNSIGSIQIDTHLVSGTAGDIVRNYSNSLNEVIGDDCQYFVSARAFISGTSGDWTSNLYFVKLYINYEEL